MRTVLTALVMMAAMVAARAQSGIDGKWAFEMNSPMGSVTSQVELKAEGKTLTGQFDMGGGRVWPVEGGVIEGDTISFTINRDGRMTYEMKGKLQGDKIVGAAGAMGTTVDWVMVRPK
ncbi:MAG: hypothetical protein ACKOEC_12905 [Acidimicrobiia bacterium]